MGSIFGGGSPQTNTTTITPPNPTGVPLQDPLMGIGTRQLGQASPFAAYGSGGNLVPQVPFGQTYLAGPNPTTFGDPFNAAHAQAFYGPNSGSAPPGQAPGGGTSPGQSGGGQNQGGPGAGSSPQASGSGGGYAQGGNGGGSYQAPPLGFPGVPQGVGQSQMPHMLSQLLQPGVLGQLFTAYGQHLQNQGQGGGLGQQMTGQIPDTNGAMQRPPMTGVPGAGGVNPGTNLFGFGGQ